MSKPKRIERRLRKLQDLGCIACLSKTGWWRGPDIHHLVQGGKRLGDDYTIPLCPWHHRGVPDSGKTEDQMERILGPSLAKNKKQFIQVFGSESELLMSVDMEIEEFL